MSTAIVRHYYAPAAATICPGSIYVQKLMQSVTPQYLQQLNDAVRDATTLLMLSFRNIEIV